MAQTGNQQATIAYKVRTTDGAPLDINGNATSDSGLKQSIALLTGQANPNPSLYDVEFYFAADAIVTGNPTILYNPAACPAGFFTITPASLVFDDANLSRVLTVISSGAWITYAIDTAIAGIFTFSQTTGLPGSTAVTITTTIPSAHASGYVTFKNTVTGDTIAIYLVHVADSSIWILATHAWNMLGFWQDAAVWGA